MPMSFQLDRKDPHSTVSLVPARPPDHPLPTAMLVNVEFLLPRANVLITYERALLLPKQPYATRWPHDSNDLTSNVIDGYETAARHAHLGSGISRFRSMVAHDPQLVVRHLDVKGNLARGIAWEDVRLLINWFPVHSDTTLRVAACDSVTPDPNDSLDEICFVRRQRILTIEHNNVASTHRRSKICSVVHHNPVVHGKCRFHGIRRNGVLLDHESGNQPEGSNAAPQPEQEFHGSSTA